jgi:hypothetical protein
MPTDRHPVGVGGAYVAPGLAAWTCEATGRGRVTGDQPARGAAAKLPAMCYPARHRHRPMAGEGFR